MKIIDLYKNRGIKNVLDIGCHTGTWDYRKTPNWNIIALEPYFYKDINKTFPNNVKLKTDNYFEYNSDIKFDLIICRCVIEHLQTKELAKKMLKKIANDLSNDGIAYIVIPKGHSLSNTIYKAFYNIKLNEGHKVPKDGGHLVNYHKVEFGKDLYRSGLIIEKYESIEADFDIYPYNFFKDCINNYYSIKGYNLKHNNMQFLCSKRINNEQ